MTIPPEILDFVASEETYPDKSVIVQEGGRGEWVYIILEGQVKIRKRTAKGMLTIETLGPGEYVGELSLLNSKSTSRPLAAVAHGPVLLGTLDSARLSHEWGVQPVELRKLMVALMTDLEETSKELVTLVEKTQ